MTDCIPRYAQPLPIVADESRCTACQREIASLRGLLDAVREDRRRLTAECKRLRDELFAANREERQ